MKFSVRVSYPETGKYNWFEAVEAYNDIGLVEVAFLDAELFLNVEIEDILMPFKKTNIKASSIHFAQFSLSKLDLFFKVFSRTTKIANSLNCDLIVIHPSTGKYEALKRFLIEEIDPVLKKEGLNRIKESIKQHYPIYYSEEKMALDFDKIFSFLGQNKFKGHLVLEYLPQFHSQLLPDGLKLKNLYEGK